LSIIYAIKNSIHVLHILPYNYTCFENLKPDSSQSFESFFFISNREKLYTLQSLSLNRNTILVTVYVELNNVMSCNSQT
jgi:hypothetical protein